MKLDPTALFSLLTKQHIETLNPSTLKCFQIYLIFQLGTYLFDGLAIRENIPIFSHNFLHINFSTLYSFFFFFKEKKDYIPLLGRPMLLT